MKSLLGIGLGCTLALLFAVSSSMAAEKREFVIGLSYGGTGPYVTSARTTETAADVAVREINSRGGVNGTPLRLVKFDTAGDPKQSALAVRRFANDDGALAILGPFSTAESRTAFPAGEREQIVGISNSATVPGVTKGFKYGFRLTTMDDLALAALLKVMKDKGLPIGSAAIMYVNDSEGQKVIGTEVFPKVLGAAGVKLAGEFVGFSMSAFDVSPQVARIMQMKPDVVAVSGVVEPALKAITELRRQNFQGRMIGSLLFADPDLAGKMGPAGDGTLYVSWFYSDANDKARKFTAAFNAENAARGIDKSGPHHVDASAYDIIYLLEQAIREKQLTGDPARIKDERAALRDALQTIRFEGVSGRTHFNDDHDAILPLYAIEVRGGKTQLLGTVVPSE